MKKFSTNIDHFGPWVWEQMGCEEWTSVGRTALGEYSPERKQTLWGVVYDNYNVGSIQMHVAISDPKSITREVISAVFEYPFQQLGVNKVIAIVNSCNAKALSLDLRLGFEIATIIRDAYERGDMYILTMTKAQCKWLRGDNYGKLSQRTAAA